MVIYSVTDDQSFNSCSKWLERVKAQRPTPELPLPGMVTVQNVQENAGQRTLCIVKLITSAFSAFAKSSACNCRIFLYRYLPVPQKFLLYSIFFSC